MNVWKSFGASVIGPGHVATGKPNQDAWVSFHRAWGDGIVVSDGLGSKQFSDFGSKAACRAVACAVYAYRGDIGIENARLAQRIKSNWLSLVAPLEARECSATCLFAYRIHDGMVRFGMLGDGLVAVVKTDGSIVSLSDDKTESFSNFTAALSPSVAQENWQWLSIPEYECRSIVLCTDGVADDLVDTESFVREFVGAHRELSSMSGARCIREMLENWPTPKHTDDKTIACLFSQEEDDE